MSKRKPILRPLALATVLAVGFALVFGMLAAWSEHVCEQVRRKNQTFEYLQIRADGVPLVYSYSLYTGLVYRTLDGVKTPRPTYYARGVLLGIPPEPWFPSLEFPLAPSQRVIAFWDEQEHPAPWYFIHDGLREGHGYFVGFDVKSKRCLGFIGRHGFRPDRPPVRDCFAVDGLILTNRAAFIPAAGRGWAISDDADFPVWKVDVISGDTLLQVDLRSRAVTTLLEAKRLLALGLGGAATKPGQDPAASIRRIDYLAVRTADRVLLLNAAGKPVDSFVIPKDLRGTPIDFYELSNRTALITSERLLPNESARDELRWIDAAGTVLQKKEIVLDSSTAAGSDRYEALGPAAAVPAPLAVVLLAVINRARYFLLIGTEPSWANLMGQSLRISAPALLAVTCLSAALAWVCYRRQRRFAQPWTGLWVAFVFLLGLPGLVGYLCHHRWPVLEKCPTCGQDVPRDREICARCGTVFPPPAPKGCEVFA